MPATKVYVKQGKKGYKEARMITEIEKAIEKKLKKDPNFSFEPAQDKDELRALYDKFVVEDTEFEELPSDQPNESGPTIENTESKHKEFRKNMEETIKKPENTEVGSSLDPFNSEEPNIRDYVLKDEFPDKKEIGGGGNSFAEPITFNDSFNIPGDDESPKQAGTDSEQQSTNSGSAEKPKEKKEEPINPAFNNMSAKDQNKSTKRMAKAIVFAYCEIIEKAGFWFATKDITHEKLLEYQLSGEMPPGALEILISLDGNTQVTVGQFFESIRTQAKLKLKVSQDDREELEELLAEVLKKKGISPTTEQNLLMVAVMIPAQVGFASYSMSSDVKSILAQLRTPGGANSSSATQAAQDSGYQKMETASAEAAAAASNQAQPTSPIPEEYSEQASNLMAPEPANMEPEIIGTEVATKE